MPMSPKNIDGIICDWTMGSHRAYNVFLSGWWSSKQIMMNSFQNINLRSQVDYDLRSQK
jgi:hypothetical protein